MQFKHFFSLLMVIFTTSALSAQCIKVNKEWGESCGDPQSIDVVYKNTCSSSLDVYFCMQRLDGSWSCGLETNLRPGKSVTSFMCQSTGKIFIDTRDAGSKDRFSEPPRQ